MSGRRTLGSLCAVTLLGAVGPGCSDEPPAPADAPPMRRAVAPPDVSVPISGAGGGAVGGATAPRAGATAPSGGASAPSGGATATPAGPVTIAAEPADEAAYIYDPNALRTYELMLAPADLATLDADPAAEQYVPGMLRFEGRDYGPVGVRYKGSAGAFLRCVGGGTIEEPSGPKICRKLSMKVAFDQFDPEGRFYGLRKLQFHAMRNDNSLMRERLGYAMFREMGVPSPRAVHARLLVNGRLEGAFVLVEQIDGRFTRARFSDGGEGNLYKEVWPIHDDAQTYIDALETNEDENPSAAGMLAFTAALETAEGPALTTVLDTYLDRDAILTYLAVDRGIGHADGPLTFYCHMPAGQGGNTGDWGNHNYYFYEESFAPRFWIIPWDLDFTFNAFGGAGLQQSAWYEPVAETGCACPAPDGQSGGFSVRRRPAGCDKLVQGLALLRGELREHAQAFVDGPFRADAVNAKLDAWSAQIAELVAEQAEDPEQQPTVAAWQSALAQLRTAVDTLRASAVQP